LNVPAPTDPPEPSKLSQVLGRASVAHRRYLNRLLTHVRAELEEHERFENYGATASSADAVQYLQQLQNSAQDKIVLSDEFIQQIIQAQQAARES
jgi:predicted metal-dependent hydrolase